MDKKSIIGFVLILVIIILYPLYMEWITGGKKAQRTPVEPQTTTDSTGKLLPSASELKEISPAQVESKARGLAPADTLLKERIVKVETELYTAEFSTRGAVLKSFTLKKYVDSDGKNIQLIPLDESSPPLNLTFPDSNVNLDSYNFQADKEELVLGKTATAGAINFVLPSQSGTQITKRYTFVNGRYDFGLELEVSGSGQLDLGRKYLLGWASGLNSTEKNRTEDFNYFSAYSMMGTELSEIKKFNQPKGAEIGTLQEAASGETKWVATRSKYFAAAIVPLSQKGAGFSAWGRRSLTLRGQEQVETRRIGVTLEMPLERTLGLKDQFMIYVGPIDYHLLRSYGMDLDRMVNLGWKIIRPFSIAVLWLFVNLHKIFPNYGLVIIFFTILMKVVFHPLTRKSTHTSWKMQELGPKLAQLKERYKKDPARLNQETMKLYKQAGVNPFSGCLPLLFQMPVFYGLFVVFRSTIELRGAKFVFWLKDLSQMDSYYVLPVIMAATMFWQQKITIKDPKQAMMVYFMPILFFFFFFKFPAGLTLYWTVFNILSLAETYYFKHKGLHRPTLSSPEESA
ncbi:MAG: membrane protein insertase YidC [Candidatus Zixiibacteriota bacterium]